MKVRLVSPVPGFQKELLDITDIFLNKTTLVTEPDGPADLNILISESANGNLRRCSAVISGLLSASFLNEGALSQDPLEEKRLHKRQEKLALYHAFVQATGRQPPWGSLTGVRPTRLVYEAMEGGLALDSAVGRVEKTFHLKPEKAALLGETVRVQQALPQALPDEADIYIGIPFCSSRCRYCSFLSREVGDGSILPRYTEALGREIAGTERLMREQGLKPRALYVGGGTPTALPEDLLKRVLGAAAGLVTSCSEVTVEAGRPDTITRGKLGIIREFGGTRISVNPQTMHDGTLELIGRRHTWRQTEEAYALARSMGFNDINMDLIAGLPEETPDMFSMTLSCALAMRPESITVHTLSVKRSSVMHREGDPLSSGRLAEAMLEEAHGRLAGAGYRPYYLYRQKHMAGNLENVGYALPGYECLYNVDMMEDRTTVLATGAGAVSKRVWPGGKRILRAPNLKDAEAYIIRADEMLERKNALMQGVGKGVRTVSAAGEQPDVLSLELEDEA